MLIPKKFILLEAIPLLVQPEINKETTLNPLVTDPGKGEHDDGGGDNVERVRIIQSFHFDKSFRGKSIVEERVDEVVILPSV